MDHRPVDRNQPSTLAGENQGIDATFTADQVARAFGLDPSRVRRAMDGEFGLPASATVDSRQAQNLAEALLSEEPLDIREAALMRLGAYTPRVDAAWGVGDSLPGQESDRQAAEADVPAEELSSRRSSYDPATQPAE